MSYVEVKESNPSFIYPNLCLPPQRPEFGFLHLATSVLLLCLILTINEAISRSQAVQSPHSQLQTSSYIPLAEDNQRSTDRVGLALVWSDFQLEMDIPGHTYYTGHK